VHRAHVASYIVEEERAAVVVERTGPAELVEPLAPAVEKAQGQDDEPWYENLRRKVQSQGQAGFIALLAETVVFWVACLIPAALIIWHEQSGSWNPNSDPESWATFMATLGSCYVFCKIPPIEAARWAWVFAWTPWIAENVLGDKPEPDDISN
jgi:hypothetical protein